MDNIKMICNQIEAIKNNVAQTMLSLSNDDFNKAWDLLYNPTEEYSENSDGIEIVVDDIYLENSTTKLYNGYGYLRGECGTNEYIVYVDYPTLEKLTEKEKTHIKEYIGIDDDICIADVFITYGKGCFIATKIK